MKIFSKIIILIAVSLMALVLLCSCSSPFFIPGASLGYFIWQDSENNIHLEYTVERKDAKFEGRIETDGIINSYLFVDSEEKDKIEMNEQKNRLDFSSKLSAQNYFEKIVLDIRDYSFVEFELKIDGANDLARIHLGRFLNNPKEAVFKIDKNYFKEVAGMPLYQVHPFSAFLYKLGKDIKFTVFYLFIFGVAAIELIRITAIRRNKKYNIYLFACYGVLAAIIALVYIFLRMIV